MNRRRLLIGATALALAPRAAAQGVVAVMRFSALDPGAALPAELRLQTFADRPRHTAYVLARDGERTVLHARSQAATAGIVRDVRVDPRQHPLLAWRWKTRRLLEKSDLATRDGDDFPARLYVSFALDAERLGAAERLQIGLARLLYGEAVPLAVLCYVWDSRAPRETIVPNAYTDRVRMLVVESGGERLGRWVAYERNVAADFRRAFALEPPLIDAVSVSVDTDNTGESAETWFGDIEFRER